MRFNANETMKLIGRQKIGLLLKEEVHQGLKDVVAANKPDYMMESDIDLAQDAFLLGYMMGKRSERRKHKGREERRK